MAKKTKTSAELDIYTHREEISEEDYADFWREYNRLRNYSEEDAHDYAIKQVDKLIERAEPEEPTRIAPKRATKADAQADLEEYGKTRIVRRNSRGQFSKRGRTWQAI